MQAIEPLETRIIDSALRAWKSNADRIDTFFGALSPEHVSSTGFVAILEVHLGSGFGCNHAGQVRPYDVADAAYGWEYSGHRRIVPRVRVGCGLIGIPEEGELP